MRITWGTPSSKLETRRGVDRRQCNASECCLQLRSHSQISLRVSVTRGQVLSDWPLFEPGGRPGVGAFRNSCGSMNQKDRLSGLLVLHLLLHRSAHVDRDTTGLHRLGYLPHQLDLEQTVLEGRAAHVDVVGEVELPAERPRRNPLVERVALGLVGL